MISPESDPNISSEGTCAAAADITCPPKMYRMSPTAVIVAPLLGTSLPLAEDNINSCTHDSSMLSFAKCVILRASDW